MKFLDRSGQRYGRLTVIEFIGKNKHKHSVWKCLCDCGNVAFVSSLGRSRGTKSCGCIQREYISALGKKSKQPDPVSRTKEYRKNLVKKIRSDPKNIVSTRISRMFCHAINNIGSLKQSKTFDQLGYSAIDLAIHIEKQFLKGMNWDNRFLWDIDHIVPISSAKNIQDVIALNQLSNLRPLWKSDNNKKKNKRTHLL